MCSLVKMAEEEEVVEVAEEEEEVGAAALNFLKKRLRSFFSP